MNRGSGSKPAETGDITQRRILPARKSLSILGKESWDISGGQPSIVIKALADSFPGTIRLLPALPSAWSRGTIEGVLGRGAITLNRLHWDRSQVEVEMTAAEAREVVLALPREIRGMTAEGSIVTAGTSSNEPRLTLPAGRKVNLAITLK